MRGRSRERTEPASRSNSASGRSRSPSRERPGKSEEDDVATEECAICYEDIEPKNLHCTQCCGKKLCNSCVCTTFLTDEGKCAFCKELFASSPTSIIVCFYRFMCRRCRSHVWFFDKTCTRRTCPNSERRPFGSVKPGALPIYDVRRYYDVFTFSRVDHKEDDGVRVTLDRSVLFSHDHGHTTPQIMYILHNNGKLSAQDPRCRERYTWTEPKDPRWFPLMASALAQCPYKKA